MPKPRKNRIREERIHNEVIVDAYGPEEQSLGWYYYLENKIKLPFTARCIASKVVSPLRKGETVEVRGLAPEDSCAHDMLVLIRWHNRNVTTPLSQLVAIDADAISLDGMKMFGVLDRATEMEGCRFSIGLRNSHDKSMRLAMTCGYRVFVCSNMAFAGDFTPVLAKHTKSFNLVDTLSVCGGCRPARASWQGGYANVAEVDRRTASSHLKM